MVICKSTSFCCRHKERSLTRCSVDIQSHERDAQGAHGGRLHMRISLQYERKVQIVTWSLVRTFAFFRYLRKFNQLIPS